MGEQEASSQEMSRAEVREKAGGRPADITVRSSAGEVAHGGPYSGGPMIFIPRPPHPHLHTYRQTDRHTPQ